MFTGKTTITVGGGAGPFQARVTGTPVDASHDSLARSFRCQRRASTPTPDGRQLLGPPGARRELRACLRNTSQQPATASPQPGFDERLRALTEVRPGARDKLDDWLDSHARAGRPGASSQAQHDAAVAQDALLQDVRTTLADLHKLETDWPQRGRQADIDLDLARLQCVRSALALVLPGLFSSGLVHEQMPALLDKLVALDRQLAATGQAGYSVDRLLGALCNHASIRELAGMDSQERQGEAIAGLDAITATMLDAVRPERDGAALSSLLGHNTELDGALKALRVKTTTDFMLRQVVRDRKGAQAQPSEAETAQARSDATALVNREARIAGLRVQLRRAVDKLDKSGAPRLLGPMSGVRFDTELVAGLRETLGEPGSQVGLIIAGLFALEREAVASPEARRLCQDIQTELGAKIGPQPERADVHYLHQRAAGLAPDGPGDTGRTDEKDGKGTFKTLKETERFLHAEVLRLVQEQHDKPPDGKELPPDTRLEDARYLLETTRGLTDTMQQTPLQVKNLPQEDRTVLLGGLTQPEVQALGLKRSDLHDALPVTAQLACQGLSSAQEAGQAFATINTVAGRLADHKGIQHLVDNDLGFLQGAKDDIKAQRLGDDLLRHLTGGTGPSLADARDKDKRGAVAQQMQRALAPLGQAISQQSADIWDRLGDSYTEDRKSILEPLKSLDEINVRREKAQATLRAYSQRHGRPIDIDRPAGYDSCKTLRRAIDLHRSSDKNWEQVRELCRSLKGFDRDRLHTPWPSRAALTLNTFLELADDPEFNEAIDAVITLRTPQPERGELTGHIEPAIRRMDGALALRSQQLDEATAHTLRSAIRTAILVQMGTTPIHTFRPADHAQQVTDTLRSWGVPVDDLRPEIDALLDAPFGANELERWRIETPQQPAETPQQALPALLQAIDSLELGTKVKLTVGSRIEVQTGAIPVEPTGLVGVNLKGAKGTQAGLEIGSTIDSRYELTLRKGWDAKGGVEASAKAIQWDGTGVKLEGTAMVEGSGAQLSGVVLRFKDRDAMKAALRVLLTQSTISPRDLGMVESIALLDEGKQGVEGGVGAKAGFDPTRVLEDSGPGQHVGGALSLRATASVAGTQIRSVIAGTSTDVRKTEFERNIKLAATASATQRGYNASSDIAEAGIATTGVYKEKTKAVIGLDRQVQPGTERQSQTTVSRGGGLQAAEKMGGEAFKRLMIRLDGSQKQADRELAGEIRKLLAAARENDLLSIAFTLDSRKAPLISGGFQQAAATRAGQMGLRTPADLDKARDGQAKAQTMLDDPDNYLLARISLIPTREKNVTRTPLNLMVFKYVTYVEDKGEFVAAEIKPDPAIVREVHDALRREKQDKGGRKAG